MWRGSSLSGLMHVALLGALIFGLPALPDLFNREFPAEKSEIPIDVELVEEAPDRRFMDVLAPAEKDASASATAPASDGDGLAPLILGIETDNAAPSEPPVPPSGPRATRDAAETGDGTGMTAIRIPEGPLARNDLRHARQRPPTPTRIRTPEGRKRTDPQTVRKAGSPRPSETADSGNGTTSPVETEIPAETALGKEPLEEQPDAAGADAREPPAPEDVRDTPPRPAARPVDAVQPVSPAVPVPETGADPRAAPPPSPPSAGETGDLAAESRVPGTDRPETRRREPVPETVAREIPDGSPASASIPQPAPAAALRERPAPAPPSPSPSAPQDETTLSAAIAGAEEAASPAPDRRSPGIGTADGSAAASDEDETPPAETPRASSAIPPAAPQASYATEAAEGPNATTPRQAEAAPEPPDAGGLVERIVTRLRALMGSGESATEAGRETPPVADVPAAETAPASADLPERSAASPAREEPAPDPASPSVETARAARQVPDVGPANAGGRPATGSETSPDRRDTAAASSQERTAEGPENEFLAAVSGEQRKLIKIMLAADRRLRETLTVRKADTKIPEEARRKTLKRLEMAAEAGFAHARYNLAAKYLRGEDVPKNLSVAEKWMSKAAEQGYPPAQVMIGLMRFTGVGLPRDLAETSFWWSLAADRGHNAAALGNDMLQPFLKPSDVVTARRLETRWGRLIADFADAAGRQTNVEDLNRELQQAAEAGNVATVLSLLARGADADSAGAEGRNAVINAAWRGRSQIIKIFLERGATTEFTDEHGRTPLLWSAINGHTAVSAYLLENGANPNHVDDKGSTALIRAAWNGHLDVVRKLIEAGADVRARDDDGRSAIDYARREGHEAIVGALSAAGAG